MVRAKRSIERAFGLVVREARAQSGLSQERLGELAGVHGTYISQLERGLKSPSLRTIMGLANALGISANEIVRAVEERIRS